MKSVLKDASVSRENAAGLSACWRGYRRISWLEGRHCLLHGRWPSLEAPLSGLTEFVHALAPGRLWRLCLGSRGGQSPSCKEQDGKGADNSPQGVTEVMKRGICLWACFVRQEKVEISALNQTRDRSTGDVQGVGGLLHQLPAPPPPGLPPMPSQHDSSRHHSCTGKTGAFGGQAMWVGGLSQPSRDAQCCGEPGRVQAEQ